MTKINLNRLEEAITAFDTNMKAARQSLEEVQRLEGLKALSKCKDDPLWPKFQIEEHDRQLDRMEPALDAAKALLKLARGEDERFVISVREPTKQMLDATRDDMEGVNACVQMSEIHSMPLVWKDDKPPLHHAYQSMLAASPKWGEHD